MNDLILIWLALIPGFALGYVGHELSHYVVLAAAGRKPSLSLWPPRARFSFQGRVSWDIRLAALAPVLSAVVLVVSVIAMPVSVGPLGWGIVIGACSRLCYLSPVDRAFALGRVPVESTST